MNRQAPKDVRAACARAVALFTAAGQTEGDVSALAARLASGGEASTTDVQAVAAWFADVKARTAEAKARRSR